MNKHTKNRNLSQRPIWRMQAIEAARRCQKSGQFRQAAKHLRILRSVIRLNQKGIAL